MANIDDQLRNVPHQIPSTTTFLKVISQAQEVLGVRLKTGALTSFSSSVLQSIHFQVQTACRLSARCWTSWQLSENGLHR